LTSTANVAAVVQYLQNNDIVVDLVGVTVSNLSSLISGGHVV